jgi:hypothetical protein
VGERASCESECGRGASSCGTGRGRGIPVEGASYKSEPERSRGTPSSRPRTRRIRYAVEAGCLLPWLSRFVFCYRWMRVPHTVGTDNFKTEEDRNHIIYRSALYYVIIEEEMTVDTSKFPPS